MSKKIGIRAWIDFAFRKIFGKPGNEICLISLLNSVCVGIKATDRKGRIFVVEMQIVVHWSFAKRALFYACSAYTDQLRAGQGYSELKGETSVRFTRESDFGLRIQP
jgi:hypothetical protein